MRCLISGTAAAASGRLTVTRTISEPPPPARCTARRACRIGRVGHRHRLDDDRRAAAHLNGPDADADGLVKFEDCHVDNPSIIASSSACGWAGGKARRHFCTDQG